MDKLILTNENVLDLLKWRDGHKDEVRSGVMPVSKLEIQCIATEISIKCFRNGTNLKLHINIEGRSRGYVVFERMDDGMWKELRRTTDIGNENVQSCLTLYCTVMAVMAFHSPSVDQDETDLKPRKAHTKSTSAATKKSKPKSDGITYIIHGTKHGPMALPKGSHASPKGIFSVRGHFRHYKSGKVVWIEEYKKGTGKKNKRKYKIAKDALS